MASVKKTINENNEPVFAVNANNDDSLTLATANTYVDKNIIFNIDSNKYVLKAGDTMTGPLRFKTTARPILDLHIDGSNLSNVYSMTTNGSLFVGDATSNGGARVYFARNVPILNTALLTGVSIGYNPKDQATWTTSSDYGIKFDINIASNTEAQPKAKWQSASFFVGLNGAYVGYTENQNVALTESKVYRVLDSNSVKQDEYIKSLEARIAALEAKIDALTAESGGE